MQRTLVSIFTALAVIGFLIAVVGGFLTFSPRLISPATEQVMRLWMIVLMAFAIPALLLSRTRS